MGTVSAARTWLSERMHLLHAARRSNSAGVMAAFLQRVSEADFVAKHSAQEVLSVPASDTEVAALAAGREMTRDACVALARRELAALAETSI